MARILAISSQVVRGHVGLSAIVPALQRLGHDVLAVPTIILSNHPGHVRAAGTRIEVNTLMSMLDVLDANGWIAGLDAIVTGYLPTPEHVYFAGQAVDLVRTRSSKALVMVDPVMGDDPRGLYVDPAAAQSMRNDLVPRADVVTPNRFELSWLTGSDVRTVEEAVVAARQIKPPHVLATSVPMASDQIGNASISRAGTHVCAVTRLAKVPHGTGDLLSALFLHHALAQVPVQTCLGAAVAGVQAAIAVSAGQSDLCLAVADGLLDWARMPPLPTEARPS
jgi:pyridoxine kinase